MGKSDGTRSGVWNVQPEGKGIMDYHRRLKTAVRAVLDSPLVNKASKWIVIPTPAGLSLQFRTPRKRIATARFELQLLNTGWHEGDGGEIVPHHEWWWRVKTITFP